MSIILNLLPEFPVRILMSVSMTIAHLCYKKLDSNSLRPESAQSRKAASLLHPRVRVEFLARSKPKDWATPAGPSSEVQTQDGLSSTSRALLETMRA
eukprot:2566086-Amphidinium_carterae.1